MLVCALVIVCAIKLLIVNIFVNQFKVITAILKLHENTNVVRHPPATSNVNTMYSFT